MNPNDVDAAKKDLLDRLDDEFKLVIAEVSDRKKAAKKVAKLLQNCGVEALRLIKEGSEIGAISRRARAETMAKELRDHGPSINVIRKISTN
jgi:hypothetical protein